MIAIVGGLVAAAMWAASALCISRSTRMIPPVAVLGWVLLIGSVISAPFALAQGVPDGLGREQVVLLIVTAIGNTTGLLLVYSSLRHGKVGVVAPITSAQGAAAAIIAVIAGEQIATGAGIALAFIVVGVVLSSMSQTSDAGSDRREGLAVTLAIGAALFFGLGLFAMGRLSEDIPIAWIIFPSRTLAVLLVTVPLAVAGRLRMTREAAPLVLASGILEVAGLVAFTIGARHGIAVAAVLGSQFAAIATIAAFFLFRERLARVQVVRGRGDRRRGRGPDGPAGVGVASARGASLAAVPDPFADHPEPELVDLRDEAVSRPALERLGKAIWDEALRYLYEVAMERPLRTMPYPEMRRAFYGPSGEPAPAPEIAAKAEEVLGEFRERVAPYVFNTQHPGSYSYFTPPPLAMSIAGEVLGQWVNQGVDVWVAGPVGALVEEEVTGWLRALIGFGEGSWAVLTSGGVMANIMALTVARDIHLAGLLGLDDPPRAGALEGARVYASDQAHFSIARALDVLGFPPETLRIVPSDDRFRLHAAPVADAVAEDRAAGLVPFAIAAVAGSTNTGTVDLTGELADLAERERLWLHVDAAYGGGAAFSPRIAPRVPDLERADSVTIDPHKWFFQAYDIGALVVKRREDLRQTFHRTPEYYRHPNPENAPLNWFEYSIEGTRRFRALKLWISWKHLGTAGFARLIEHNVDLAAYLVARCREATTSRSFPTSPSSRSCASATCPRGSKARRWTRTRTGCSARSRRAARRGSRRRRSGAPPTCGPAS